MYILWNVGLVIILIKNGCAVSKFSSQYGLRTYACFILIKIYVLLLPLAGVFEYVAFIYFIHFVQLDLAYVHKNRPCVPACPDILV